MQAAAVLAGVAILLASGGAVQAAVREVDSMPGFAQLAANAPSASSQRRVHEQTLLGMIQRGEDARALAYAESLSAREPLLAPALHEALAGAYVRDRRLYRATQHLDAIPAARRSDQAWYVVGHIAARQQRLEVASDALGRLAKRLPDDPLVARDEAQLASLQGQTERAAAACERLLRQRPGDAEATLLLARVRVQQGRWADAERLLTDVFAREPRHGRIALHLGLVQLALGKPIPARATLVRARSLEAASASPYVAVAAVGLLLGDAAAARASASGALKIDPADPSAALVSLLAQRERWPPSSPGNARFLASAVFPDLETEPLADSVRVELGSADARARLAVLTILSELLSPHAALHWLTAEPVAAMTPLLQLAAVRAEMAAGNAKAAQFRLETLARSDAARGLVGPPVHAAILASRRDDPAGARVALDRALAVAPDSPRLRMLAGDLLLVLDQPAQAVREYRAALDDWPRDPRLLNQLARSLSRSGASAEWEEAIRLTEIALRQQPHYLLRAALLDTRADALFRLGRRPDALAAYRELSTTVGGMTTPEQWHRLGDLARDAADAPLARKAYEEALDYGREYAGRVEARRYLDRPPIGAPQK